MIPRIFTRLFLLLFTVLSSTHIARAVSIRNFDVIIRAQKDGTLDVTENIVISFGKEQEHGIYRWIPLQKTPDSDKEIQIRLLSAKQGQKPAQTQTEIKERNWYIWLGSPEKMVSGVQKYSIRYLVRNAIFRNGEKPRVTWNAFGQWPYRIDRATVRFYAPKGIDARHLPAQAFVGNDPSWRAAAMMRWRRSLLWYAHNLPPQKEIFFDVTLPRNSMSIN